MVVFRRFLPLMVALPLALFLGGCGLSIPSDPDGVFDRIEGGVLSIGVSPEHGLIEKGEDGANGPLAELMNDFAVQHDAGIEWVFAGEESLIDALTNLEVFVLLGGFSAESPWSEHAGMTRAYTISTDGKEREIVLLIPMGQNRLLAELESFLDERLQP